MESRNRSTVTEFILLGFTSDHNLQVLIFSIFLIYMVILVANTLLILAVIFDHHLHNPMYFFLVNLSIINIGNPSVIVPKMLVDFLSGNKGILFAPCVTQAFFNLIMGGIEFILLLFMAYDRYVAICKPLRYSTMMSTSACVWMITLTWILITITSSVNISILFSLSFCGPNFINHFFCLYTSLAHLSCSDTSIVNMLMLIESVFLMLIPLLLIILSYYAIIASIMRIQSGRYKAFSSCSSHLAVVTLFYGFALIMIMRPHDSVEDYKDKIISIFYVIIIPMLNPLIYSLRNKDVHRAMRRLGRLLSQ
uniref:Olfactory receptor n=1 Tax=Leptobrachium leishanense TaxID=445787 RepID=A0A8C5M6I1_9ANUR